MKAANPPIVVEQGFDSSISEVWKALTSKDQMVQWYFTNINAFEPKVGSHSQFEVHSGERVFTHMWKVTEVTPLKSISYTWNYKEYSGDAIVTFTLKELGKKVMLKLSMQVLEDFPDGIPEFRRESCMGGWQYFLQGNLKDYLDGSAKVVAVSKSDSHSFTKFNTKHIKLIKGLGIEGDVHMGKTVKHRSRVAKNPAQPNLRQVHLIHSELFDELSEKGYSVSSGAMGENITTRGIDLHALPRATRLKIGVSAIVEITGLRNPCTQLNALGDGLMQTLIYKDKQGNIIRKAGIMGIVLEGGIILPGDSIQIELPEEPYYPLEKV